MDSRDLSGRTVWPCIEVTPDEAATLRRRGSDLEQEEASKLIAKLHKKSITHH